MIHNIKLSDTVLTVSLPSERLAKLLQLYVNQSVDVFGRVDWTMVRCRAKRDLDNRYIECTDYSYLLSSICDLCNFESIYPIVF